MLYDFSLSLFLCIFPYHPSRISPEKQEVSNGVTFLLYLNIHVIFKEEGKKIKNKKLPLRVENCSVFQRTNPVGPLFLFFFFIIFIFYFLEVQT